MQYLLLILTMILLACHPTQKITDSNRIKIISELDFIQKIDQKYAGIPPDDWMHKFGYEKAWKMFELKRDSIGIDNQNKIKHLYSQYGYLGFKEVGEENAYKFWVTIQHADNDVQFQKKMLKALKKQVRKNNAPKNNYALLEDRVAVNRKQKQRFGSQLKYNEKGQAIPKIGITDSINIDKIRTEYDLPPLKEYYNQMTKRHFEMNKAYFSSQGITEPFLYK